MKFTPPSAFSPFLWETSSEESSWPKNDQNTTGHEKLTMKGNGNLQTKLSSFPPFQNAHKYDTRGYTKQHKSSTKQLTGWTSFIPLRRLRRTTKTTTTNENAHVEGLQVLHGRHVSHVRHPVRAGLVQQPLHHLLGLGVLLLGLGPLGAALSAEHGR